MTGSGGRPEEDGEPTAMAMLRARARASARRWPLVNDPAAVEIVAAACEAGPDPILDVHVVRYLLRTRVLDRWATAFLAAHPDATVVEIGSGLSTRFERVDNGRAHWVHIDPPAILALREELFPGSPRRTGVVGDIGDPSWIPALTGRSAPHLILIESRPLVLDQPDARRLVSTLVAHCEAARIAAPLRDRLDLGAELRGLALQHLASRSVARELANTPPWSWWRAPVGVQAARACLHTDSLFLLQCPGLGAATTVPTRPIDRLRQHRGATRPRPTQPSFRAARHARSRALLAARRASTARDSDLPTSHQETPPCPRSPRSTPLSPDLTRRRFRLAAAAGGWRVGPHRSPRTHAARSLVEFDTLLALGIVPVTVGSTGLFSLRPLGWTAVAQEADIAVTNTSAGADLAVLRTAGVELVVVSTQLAQAAPLEMADYLRLDVPVVQIPHDDVVEQLRRVGAAVALSERAENLAATLDRRIEEFSPTWSPRSICVFTDRGDGQVYVMTPHAPLAVLLRQVGLPSPTCPPLSRYRGRPDWVPIPRSRLRELDADLLLGLDLDGGALAPIETDPRFAALPAVRDRRYRRLDPTGSYAAAVPSVLP